VSGARGATRRIDALDGLRAVAMTMVVAQHCHLLPFGWTGVWLFFLISGYVITLGFLAGAYPGRGFGARYGAFMAARAARIVPAYLLYLGACLAVLLALAHTGPLGDLPYLLSFTFNWQMIFGFWPGHVDWAPLGHLWTLSVEQQFYLLYPLLALGLLQRWQSGAIAALIATGPLLRWGFAQALAAHGVTEPGDLAFAVYAATPCHLDAFLLGALVARLERGQHLDAATGRRIAIAAAAIALAYAATYVAINRALGATGIDMLRNVISGVLAGQQREVFVYLAVDAVALAVLVHTLRGGRGSAWLGSAPLAWVGRVSYGGYLFHALVLWGLARSLGLNSAELPVAGRLLFFAVGWSLTVALASASFVWIEQPLARRWRRGRAPAAPGRGASSTPRVA